MNIKQKFINYFEPNYIISNLNEITSNFLIKQKIKVIICDLDNTLMNHLDTCIKPEGWNFLCLCKQLNIKVFVCSNNKKQRMSLFLNVQNKNLIDGFVYSSKKPLVYKIKNKFKELQNYNQQNILVIGDQFFSDIWFAKKMHYLSVLVLTSFNLSKQENKQNILIKWFDHFIYKNLKKYQ